MITSQKKFFFNLYLVLEVLDVGLGRKVEKDGLHDDGIHSSGLAFQSYKTLFFVTKIS